MGRGTRRTGSPFCIWHRYIPQLFHFENSAPFLSKTLALSSFHLTTPPPCSHPFVFSIPASVSSPSSVFFLCLHPRTRSGTLEGLRSLQ